MSFDQKVFVEIVESLGYEGIPVSAIARATRQESSYIREILENGVATGRIVAMPRSDWPIGGKGDRGASRNFPSPVPDDLIPNCIRLFKVTKLQAYLLAALLNRKEVSKEAMHQIIESRRRSGGDETDPKMVDVVICHLRKRLKPFKLTIMTLWACGYYMEPSHRTRALKLLDDFSKEFENQK